jgi:pimeloyl-ACP methyl ester carboxylesterase
VPTTNPASGPDATSGYVPVNGLDMYYEIHGEGSPLALFHGAMGTIDSCFANLLPVLAATRQVVAIELQGHGHTADIDRPLSYRQMAADAAALLEALGIEMADLVGYSLAGAVALELAMQHPVLQSRFVTRAPAAKRQSYWRLVIGSGLTLHWRIRRRGGAALFLHGHWPRRLRPGRGRMRGAPRGDRWATAASARRGRWTR